MTSPLLAPYLALDSFCVTIGRWRVAGASRYGWVVSTPNSSGHDTWTALARGKALPLDAAVVLLRQELSRSPGADSDLMHVTLDALVEAGGWGWPLERQDVVPSSSPLAADRSGVGWVANPRREGWLLFEHANYVCVIYASEVYARAWEEVRDLVRDRIHSSRFHTRPDRFTDVAVFEFRMLSFPGAPNSVSGPCRVCEGSGVHGRVVCGSCGGQGDHAGPMSTR